MYPHRIRLRGPWQCQTPPQSELDAAALAPSLVDSSGQVSLPCRWGEGALRELSAPVRLARRFQWLGRIDAHERMWLVLQHVEGLTQVQLNGTLLERPDKLAASSEFEITAIVRARNELSFLVEPPREHRDWWGQVALEIRCTAFLRGVRLLLTRTELGEHARATGELVGEAERPLELYLLADGRTVAYTMLEPSPAGQSFELISESPLGTEAAPCPEGGQRMVRLELVNAAVAWYTLEESVSVSARG